MGASQESFAVHVLNMPAGVRWRQVKAELLLASGIPEETVLHIQVLDRSCVVSLNSRQSSEVLVDELDGALYKGRVLTVRTEEQLQYHQQLHNNTTTGSYPVYPLYQQYPMGAPMQAQIQTIQPQMLPPQDYYPLYPMPLMSSASSLQQPLPSSSSSNTTSTNSPSSSYTYRGLQPPRYDYRVQSGQQQQPPPSTPVSLASSSVFNSSPSISLRVLNSLRQYPYQYQTITEIGPIPDTKRLFIGNIPYASQWSDLKDYLRLAGNIVRVEIPTEPDGTSKGFAIATYSSEIDAINAIEKLNGELFQGRQLTVRFDRFRVRGGKDDKNYDVEKSLDEVIKKIDSSVKQKDNEEVVELEEEDDDQRFDDEARNLIESLTLE